MLRKTILAIAAVSAVAAASYTPANALPVGKVGPPVVKPHGDGHSHHRGFYGPRFAFAPFFADSYETCLQKVWVKTPHGLRWRWVDTCAY